eukprot:CAMPEP_0177647608 /NCGR_PEP_ID=MMETSP0447-20121125/10390_1 /TAXON_ID=0 /ORGANISM="Stygamoeba regulata, Strain BSH-02190019" /LENGTH=1335 /DNA_ID=CAMNT_0019150203 /DNA_START=738 /DNA_END=4746 /DNA_ORIENTATION=+
MRVKGVKQLLTGRSFPVWACIALLCCAIILCSFPVAVQSRSRSRSSSYIVARAAYRKESGDKILDVYVIPHSHLTPGWLRTYTEYFDRQVSTILTSVVEELMQDESRRFSWAEISFFSLWWAQQSDPRKDVVRGLVSSGQLEFIEGGWVQHDEANTEAEEMLRQVTEGHEFLMQEFGVRPRIAWQIDPFGHSSLSPTMFSQLGMDVLVGNRIHFRRKGARRSDKSLEFIWRGSPSLGEKSDLFTHILYNHYSAIKGFDWEDPTQRVTDENVELRSEIFIQKCFERATAYRHNLLMVPFGDDFKFQKARLQFSQMDMIKKFVNERTDDYRIRIRYATPSEYFDALAQYDVEFPTFQGDFFPYADNENSYWTGYYTTRPTMKLNVRESDSAISSAEALLSIASVVDHFSESTVKLSDLKSGLTDARRNNALFFHHDGITGTAKSKVVTDYYNRLLNAEELSHTVVEQSLVKILRALSPEITEKTLEFLVTGEHPVRIDPSAFKTAEQRAGLYPLLLSNPLGWTRDQLVQLRGEFPEDVCILDSSGEPILSQLSPSLLTQWRTTDPSDSKIGELMLSFFASVPPVGFRIYFLSFDCPHEMRAQPAQVFDVSVSSEGGYLLRSSSDDRSSAELVLENSFLQVSFTDEQTLPTLIHNKLSDEQLKFQMKLGEYSQKKGGAYIMRPEGYEEHSAHEVLRLVRGPLFDELLSANVHPRGEPSFARDEALPRAVRFRVVKSDIPEMGSFLRIAYDIRVGEDKEFTTRFYTDMKTDRVIFTDNSLESIRRDFGVFDDKTEQNYFPAPRSSFIRDSSRSTQMTVLTPNAMGAHSPADGALELMLHRHLMRDDGRGLGEGVKDHSPLRSEHWLQFAPTPLAERQRMLLAARLNKPLAVSVAHSLPQWFSATQFSLLKHDLPQQVALLSFETRHQAASAESGAGDIIGARFVNLWESNDHSPLPPQEARFDFAAYLIGSLQVDEASRTVLSFNNEWDAWKPTARQWKSEAFAEVPRTEFLNDAVFSRDDDDRQNTDEEGVFISQAALDEAAEAEADERTAAHQKRGRQLLAHLTTLPVHLTPLETKAFQLRLSASATFTQKELFPLVRPLSALEQTNTRSQRRSPPPERQRTLTVQPSTAALLKDNVNAARVHTSRATPASAAPASLPASATPASLSASAASVPASSDTSSASKQPPLGSTEPAKPLFSSTLPAASRASSSSIPVQSSSSTLPSAATDVTESRAFNQPLPSTDVNLLSAEDLRRELALLSIEEERLKRRLDAHSAGRSTQQTTVPDAWRAEVPPKGSFLPRLEIGIVWLIYSAAIIGVVIFVFRTRALAPPASKLNV